MANDAEVQAVADVAAGAETKGPEGLALARAKFDELLAKRKAQEADDEPPKKAKPQKAAKAEKAPAKAEESAEPAKKDPKVEQLRAKLLLAGAPKKALESLPDDEVREWWKNVEEREAAQEQALQRASAAERELKKATDNSEPTKGVPTEDSDLEDIARELADQFGEVEGGTLLKALRQLTEPYRTRIESLEGVIRAAQSKGVEDISAKNRERLSQKLPHLKENDRAWEMLHGQVLAAFEKDPTSYSTPEEAYDDIYEALYGGLEVASENGNGAHDSHDDDETETAALKARIAASSPTVTERKGKPKPATPLDAARSVFNHLREDPEDSIGASRVWRRAVNAK